MSRTSIMVYSEMGLLKLPLVVLLCSVFSLLSFIALCDASELTVKFLKTPQAFSNLSSTTFVFEVLVGGSSACTYCNITCKLDDDSGSIIASECENGTVFCEGLQDGNHKFEVCPNGSQGVGCSSYNWTVDTVPPTANITASTNFTNALYVPINISFSEPCTGTGGPGFVCSSVNACNLLVHGAGKVIPNSLKILQPNLQYSVLVNLSSTAQYGRVILIMDKSFCTDSAGNKFERNKNSNFTLRFDRRTMVVNLTTHVPERQLVLDDVNGETRLVLATNNCVKLRICITFLVPVLNSSAEILKSLEPEILYSLPKRQGKLLPLNVSKDDPGHRRFEFMVDGCISGMAIVTVGMDENSITSIHETPVSKVDPITFLFDSLRPAPMLITPPSDSLMPVSTPPSDSLGPDENLTTLLHMRTREHNIPMSIEFMEPVFGFNDAKISINGGYIESFKEESKKKYAVVIRAFHEIVSVNVPENVAQDAAGNKNLASKTLPVRPYSVPKISTVILVFATTSFVATSIAAGLLTASIASLSSIGTFSPPFSSLPDPASNLFRMAGHIQVFALSTWLGVTLPVEYYELARGLHWSIPYFNLPWETGRTHSSPPANSHPRSKIHDSGIFLGVQNRARAKAPMRLKENEYSFFENSGPDPVSDGWENFSRIMFWLAIIGGSLILLHALLLAILKFRKQRQRGYGVLAFPRFEIFLVNLAVPSICEASAALIRGGTTSGIVVGTLILVAVSFLLLDLLWFLSTGIKFAKRVLIKEDNQATQVGQRNPRIAQVTLGPGNEGRWTLNGKQNSDCLTMLVPLFEDLTGPIAPDVEAGEDSGGTDLAPSSLEQSMSRSTRPSHIPPTRSSTVATPAVPSTSSTSAHTHGDYQIIAPDDKTEEVEVSGGSVSSIQNLFMQLRIYYTLLESVRRVMLGALGGAYKNTWSSTIPVIILLCITSLQLFFLVLEKPFIKRRVQLVEIISVASEVCVFALTLVLLDKKLSSKQETIVGVSMLVLFLMGFLPQIVNELYALRRQIKQLDTTNKRFRIGLRIASFGILLFFFSQESLNYDFPDCFGDKDLNETGGEGGEKSTNVTGDQGDEDSNVTGDQGDENNDATKRNRNSGRRNKNSRDRKRNRNENRNSETTVPEKSWLNQLVKAVTNCLGIA